ncbi:2-oxoglutarate dehydrogenase, E2 component, dihydrolipoamide succinyltransferase [Brachybacterium endophyticum]|uniref:Dihydrolipoamide acetyltransferase component of pyruvate dehydrogenase complex n=1 Tax=Brachybacterium endophyticum TaxID=2182385 RepID=A0A2U2RIE9_9MICO|nr:2-oxoglutarate dehydrogenase, E2 component, dihydrolipoamide succinyltransferase [Brachybacterium endophyticum]PWH05653.1 2-oxoglutarate dehydrogenase, E2 component, dihydrolipoamide succinyltransferase [Brachybacterium endophyticum]
MSETVKMPALGESVTEGTVTRWLKSVGDTVEVDEPLLEVSTDKVDTEVPSPVAGTIEKILVDEDEDADVGADLVVIGDGSGSESSDSGDSGASAEASEDSAEDSSGGEDLASDETVAPSTEQGSDEQPASEKSEQSEAPAEGSSDAGSGSGGGASGTDVQMPALGESVTEGTVTRWLKSVGDTVEEDEPLLEVSTDKVDTEIPSPVAGTLLEVRVQEDEDAEVGSVIAVIGDASGAASGSSDSPQEKPAAASEEKAEEKPAQSSEKSGSSEKPAESTPAKAESKPEQAEKAPEQAPAPSSESAAAPAASSGSAPKAADSVSGAEASGYVTPLVRKMASEAGVDLSTVTGSGLGGRIRKQDVQKAIDAKSSAAEAPAASAPAGAPAAGASAQAPKVEVSPLRGTEEKMSRLRKIVASRMVESLQTQAQLTTAVEVDMTRIAKLRGQAKDSFAQREGAKLTFLPFIMQAAVEALKTFPKLNAEIDGDLIKYHGSENIGMAADTDRGLVVPVIKNAGDLNLAGLARQIGDLGKKAKDNKLGPDDLQGATFTITNTGSGGALFDTPIVPNPQVGILGCGTIVKRPAVITTEEGDEVIAVRSMMYLFLSYDHRLVDGGDAARFLSFMKQRLEGGAFGSELGL